MTLGAVGLMVFLAGLFLIFLNTLDSQLAVAGTLNSAAIYTDLSGTITVSGLGAGSIETASAILTDIISIYRTKRIDAIF